MPIQSNSSAIFDKKKPIISKKSNIIKDGLRYKVIDNGLNPRKACLQNILLQTRSKIKKEKEIKGEIRRGTIAIKFAEQ